MSEAAEEVTDGPVAAENPQERQRSSVPAAGEVLDGKRVKKTVERLDFQAPKQLGKLKIVDGGGDKLGDIPRISYQIGRIKPAELKPLHAILFDRPGKISTVKKNLRLFNGFSYPAGGDQFTRKREKILKSFTNSKLRVMCGVLDLEKKGTHSDLVDRIMSFLSAPTNSGKLPPAKKKRRSKKILSGDDSKARTKKKVKPKPRTSSSSPKKSMSGSKSKAIVMDSSSDEDEEEEPKEEADASDAEKQSEREEQTEKSGESEEEEEEEDDDESPKSKTGRAKPAAKKAAASKRQRAPARREAPPKKRGRKVSDESDSDSDEKPKKKKSATTKPAAKTKKADSSSNSKNTTNTADDSSDDDEPLINIKIKKAPRDDQLRETVQSLLKEANLEEMTMKQICQRVFDTYPEHDLSGKKDYIKQTVKSLIT